MAGRVEASYLLIKRGADVNAETDEGFTPLDFASDPLTFAGDPRRNLNGVAALLKSHEPKWLQTPALPTISDDVIK